MRNSEMLPDRLSAIARDHEQRFGALPDLVVSAPGRVNLIGEHTDYNDGFVLPMAIPMRTVLSLARAGGATGGKLASALFGGLETIEPGGGTRQGNWADYARGVVREITRAGHAVGGFVGVVSGDLPLAGGLSSSASFEVAIGTGLARLFGIPLPPEEIARFAQRAENEFVGVRCGIMDQYASALGRERHALWIDCRAGSVRPIPVALKSHSFFLAHSRVERTLASSAYNERRSECERAVAILREAGWEVRTLSDIQGPRLDDALRILPGPLRGRARHVVTENARVVEAVGALERGDVVALGRLFTASHESLRRDYQVSHPWVDDLVGFATTVPGVLGARVTGAGFGGFVIVLGAGGSLARLQESLERDYYRPRGVESLVLDAGPGSDGSRVDWVRPGWERG